MDIIVNIGSMFTAEVGVEGLFHAEKKWSQQIAGIANAQRTNADVEDAAIKMTDFDSTLLLVVDSLEQSSCKQIHL
jgi:hypothetical protein